jgi:hypothetical protein
MQEFAVTVSSWLYELEVLEPACRFWIVTWQENGVVVRTERFDLAHALNGRSRIHVHAVHVFAQHLPLRVRGIARNHNPMPVAFDQHRDMVVRVSRRRNHPDIVGQRVRLREILNRTRGEFKQFGFEICGQRFGNARDASHQTEGILEFFFRHQNSGPLELRQSARMITVQMRDDYG